MTIFRLAWSLLRGHPARALLVVVGLAVAVAGRVAVDTAVAGIEGVLAREARQVLGGDLEIAASRPWTEAERAQVLPLLPPGTVTTEVRTLVTMARASGPALPVEVRAVQSAYPLVGRLQTDPPGLHPGEGEAVVEADLLPRLGVTVGDRCRLGGQEVRIIGTLGPGGDPAAQGISLGPRVLVGHGTLATSGLAGQGSRQRYLWLATVPTGDPTDLAVRLRTTLGLEDTAGPGPTEGASSGLRIRSAAEAQRSGLQRLEAIADFLRLTALMALLLGALGIVALVRAHVVSRAEDVAMLRLLGATRGRVLGILLSQCTLLGLTGGVLGSLLGVGVATVMIQAVAGLLPGVTTLTWHPPAVVGGLLLGTGLGLLAGLPPVLNLIQHPPAAILRGETPASRAAWLPGLLILLAVASLAVADLGVRGAGAVAVLVAVGAVLAGLFRVVLPMVARVPLSRQGSRRALVAAAIANLGRPGLGGVAAASALGGAGLLLGLILILRSSLLAELDPGRTDGRPALFLIDAQVDEIEDLRSAVATAVPTADLRLAPMVRARLRQAPALTANHDDPDLARRFRDREQNLSFRSERSSDETLVEGTFPDPQATDPPQVSLEERWARRLGYRVGDLIRFDIQGVPLEGRVTSLRRVRWTSLRPNFFVLVSSAALVDAPQTWIGTVAGIDDTQRRDVQARLTQQFPGLTVLDVAALARQMDELVTRVGVLVQVLTGLAVLAGLILLAGLALVSAQARRGEAALYRVLGADRGGILVLIGVEFLVLAAVAGLAGLMAAAAVAAAAFPWVWTVPLTLPLGDLGVAWVVIALIGSGTGILGCRSVLRATPGEVLRAG